LHEGSWSRCRSQGDNRLACIIYSPVEMHSLLALLSMQGGNTS
jgi:hypothetical protein